MPNRNTRRLPGIQMSERILHTLSWSPGAVVALPACCATRKRSGPAEGLHSHDRSDRKAQRCGVCRSFLLLLVLLSDFPSSSLSVALGFDRPKCGQYPHVRPAAIPLLTPWDSAESFGQHGVTCSSEFVLQHRRHLRLRHQGVQIIHRDLQKRQRPKNTR